MTDAAIRLSNLSKSFVKGQPVLNTGSLGIEKGEMVALIGASGSGKSTLIRSFAYAETAAIIIIIVLTVSLIDVLSAQVRRFLV